MSEIVERKGYRVRVHGDTPVSQFFQGQQCSVIFEHYYLPSEGCPDTIKCIGCEDSSCVADLIFLPKRFRTRSCSSLRPFVYFEAQDGRISFAGRGDDPTPHGYERREITNLHEMQRFETRINQLEKDKVERNKAQQQDLWEDWQRYARAETRREMQEGRFLVPATDAQGNVLLDPSGNPQMTYITVEGADESAPGGGHNLQFLRDVMKMAQERADRGSPFSPHDPGLHLHVLHNDEHSKGRFSR
jgi:hypothetical protein